MYDFVFLLIFPWEIFKSSSIFIMCKTIIECKNNLRISFLNLKCKFVIFIVAKTKVNIAKFLSFFKNIETDDCPNQSFYLQVFR